jgi:DnaK suppressor protein
MAQKKTAGNKNEQFKKVLLKSKENIVHDIKNMAAVNSANNKDNGGDVSSHSMHIADVATDMYDREFSLGLASNDRELLNRIEAALARIANRTFGACSVCKKPIAAARLKAIPYVETCLKCQEQLETKKR